MTLKPNLDFAIKQLDEPAPFRFSVCTLVTDMQEYSEMIASFVQAGFDKTTCEYRYIDNSEANSFDAYKGYNLFLQHALGEYIILCHQDVLLNFDGINELEQRLKGLDEIDSNWAIASNAGGIENSLFRRVAHNVFYPNNPLYPNGHHHYGGNFPQKSISADESFIVVKRASNLVLSKDMEGFHLHGTDICLIANLLGYTSYIIDFKLTHKSYGSPGESFKQMRKKLIEKYSRFMRDRRITTTITDFYLSGSAIKTAWAETRFVKKIARKKEKFKIRRDKGNGFY